MIVDNDSFMNHLQDVGEDAYIIRMERPVTVRVAEVRNLPKGVSGTWVEVLVEDRSAGRTPTKFKEKNPFFGEDICLTLKDDELYLHVILWKESIAKKGSLLKKKTELGRVRLNLDEVQSGDNWYTIEKKTVKTNIDIRMSIIYHEITILPSHKYTKLLDMLLDQKTDFKIIMLLATSGEIKSKEAAELAEILAQIGDSRGGLAPDIINNLLTHDITTTDCKETLFRANSVGTKALDYYMKFQAARWLDCLRPLVQTIIQTDRYCEVRDAKLNPDDNWRENAQNLEELFDATIKAIFSSVRQCPLPLRKIFHHIRKQVRQVFPDSEDVSYTAVTGFLFLRFFVPAIMTPKLFGLAGDYSTGNTERTFTLVATLLQKLANLQLFELHEAHFDQLNPILVREQENLKKFVDFLSESENPVDEEALVVNSQVDLDLMVARLCRHMADHLKPLEDALPAKLVVVFLGELEVVFEEMKFLWKKFKNDQSKRRKMSTQSAPSTPARERSIAVIRERTEPERVRRRHSFSLERLTNSVKVNSKDSRREKSLSMSESVSRNNSKNDLEGTGETEGSKEDEADTLNQQKT